MLSWQMFRFGKFVYVDKPRKFSIYKQCQQVQDLAFVLLLL